MLVYLCTIRKLMSTICDVCGLPEELCVCEDVSKSETRIDVYVDDRKFNDVTIASGFDDSNVNISELESELKRELACGGTSKEDKIELQGNHSERLTNILEERGYIVN